MKHKDNIIRYEFFSENPFTHFLDLKCEIPCNGLSEIHLGLSFWRPGRYEPGNFAKNIRGFRVKNSEGQHLRFVKTDKQTWKINCEGQNIVKVEYQYYASELNAGSCYVDERQMYVNPVHCVFRCMEMPDVAYEFSVRSKDGFSMACSLPVKDGKYRAENYDEFVDSPFIYSSELITHSFKVQEIPFYIHINGKCEPDFSQMEKDFGVFIEEQFKFWQDIPFSEYHFMFQITPYPFYHGVEHANNTVIAIGPGYDIYSRKLYLDVLGIASHELFHAWNVKKMRPVDFFKYDYSKENYSQLGFVYEGFTTYLGDKLLLRAGLFTTQEFLEEMSVRLKRHMHNSGKWNYSLLESSFDTWLDGYIPGIPGRKTSIYDEGCLVSFLLDVALFRFSKGQYGIEKLCREMWNRYGRLKAGYTYDEIKSLSIQLGGDDAKYIFENLIEKPMDYTSQLLKEWEYLGVECVIREPDDLWERYIGLKCEKGIMGWKILSVWPESPAHAAGIFIGDEMISLNGHLNNDNPSNWLRHYLYSAKAQVLVAKQGFLKTLDVQWNLNRSYFGIPDLNLVRVESNENRFFKWLSV